MGALIAVLLAFAAPHLGFAQSEGWSAEEDDARRREIVRRYRTLLERRPVEGVILDRLLSEVGGGRAFDALLADYEQHAQDEPGDFAHQMILGHLYKHARRLDEATEAYRRAADLRPDSPWPHQSMGDGLYGAGRLEEAEAAYEMALDRGSSREERRRILFALADIAFGARDFERATAYLQCLVEDAPDDVYLRMQLADVLIENRQYASALVHYQAVVDLSSRDTRRRAVTLGLMGDVYLELGQFEEAVARYRQGQGLAVRSSWLWTDLERRVVDAYRSSSDVAGLVAEYEETWRRPSNEQLRILAELYQELGRDEEAESALRRAVRANRRDVDSRLALIALYERRGDLAGAIREYREVVRTADEPIHRVALARLQRRAGRDGDSLDTLEEMERAHRGNASGLSLVAEVYLSWGERDRAIRVYEQLVRIDEEAWDSIVALGEVYFMEDRWTDALNTWRRLLHVIDDPVDARVTLARVLAGHGMVDEAVELLDEASAMTGDQTEVLRARAEVLEDARRFSAAVLAWQRLVDVASDAQVRDEARGRLISLYSHQGVLADRIGPLARAWEGGEGPPEAGTLYGEALLRLGRFSEAELVFAGLLVRDPESVSALTALGQVYEGQGRFAQAIAVREQLAALDSSDARRQYDAIVELALRAYDHDTALEFAGASLSENPHDARAHAALGAVYRRLGQLGRAAEHYEEAVRLDGRAYRFALPLSDVLLAVGDNLRASEVLVDVMQRGRDRTVVLEAGRRAIQAHRSSGTLDQLLAEVEAVLARSGLESEGRRLAVQVVEQMVAPLRTQSAVVEEPALSELAEQLEAIGQRATRVFLAAARDTDVRLRVDVVRLIADTGREEAASVLWGSLSDPEEEVRLEAALALGRLGLEDQGDALTVALSDASPGIRAAAAWALGRGGSSGASDRLAQALRGEQNDHVAAALAVALGRVGGDDDIDNLLSMLAERRGVARHGAALGLALLGADPASLRGLLGSPDADDRRVAAWSLSWTPASRDTVSALLDRMWSDQPVVRQACRGALLQLGQGGLQPPDALGTPHRRPSFWSGGGFDGQAYLEALLVRTSARPSAGAPWLGRLDDVLEAHVAETLESGSGATQVALVSDMLASGLEGGLASMGDGMNAGLRRRLASRAAPLVEALVQSPDERVARRARSLVRWMATESVRVRGGEPDSPDPAERRLGGP